MFNNNNNVILDGLHELHSVSVSVRTLLLSHNHIVMMKVPPCHAGRLQHRSRWCPGLCPQLATWLSWRMFLKIISLFLTRSHFLVTRLGWDVLCFLIFSHPCWTIEIVFVKIWNRHHINFIIYSYLSSPSSAIWEMFSSDKFTYHCILTLFLPLRKRKADSNDHFQYLPASSTSQLCWG